VARKVGKASATVASFARATSPEVVKRVQGQAWPSRGRCVVGPVGALSTTYVCFGSLTCARAAPVGRSGRNPAVPSR
jgi:hypothetical protein